MKKNRISAYIMTAALAVVLFNCTKPAGNLRIPPEQAHFTNVSSGAYFITAPGVTYTINVGLTTVSDKDRTITFSVASPTGAVQGTDYTLSATSVTIPKGETLGSFVVAGQYNNYTAGQKDTLVFTIQNSEDTRASDYNSTFTLLMRGPCFDGDVADIQVMAGAYTKSFDPDEPSYTVAVTNLVSTGPTTATGKIANLWNWFGAVNINFDWTDPANPRVSIPWQTTDKFYSSANNQPFGVRTSPGQPNKFSVCTDQISLMIDIIVENYPGPGQAAYYEQNFPVTIRR